MSASCGPGGDRADYAARRSRDRGPRRRRPRHRPLRPGLLRRAAARRRSFRSRSHRQRAVEDGVAPARGRGLEVQPGDVICYYARARDVGRGKRPSETRSDMFFLEVRPFSEEFVARPVPEPRRRVRRSDRYADHGAEGDHRRDVEHRAPRRIWRRTLDGDINAIAAAQAELKGRVDQIASRGSAGRRVPAVPAAGGAATARPAAGTAGGADPVAAAASAMARAIDQLNGARTTDALPHEMAALQGLLQAQAEVRRREVSQQAGAAGSRDGPPGAGLVRALRQGTAAAAADQLRVARVDPGAVRASAPIRRSTRFAIWPGARRS